MTRASCTDSGKEHVQEVISCKRVPGSLMQGGYPYSVMSTPRVSRMNSVPITRVIVAMQIGYHRP